MDAHRAPDPGGRDDQRAEREQPDQPGRRQPSRDSLTAPALRQAAVLVAVVVFLVRTGADFNAAADSSALAASIVAALSLALVILLILAICVPRALRWVELALFGAGVGLVLVEQRQTLFTRSHTYPSDEGRLGAWAIEAVRQGHNPYTMHWPGAATFAGNTPLYGGGGVTRFGYPPLSTEVGAGLGWIWAPLGTPGVVCALGLLAAAALSFLLLPVGWRSLALTVLLGLTPFTTYAVNGHPMMLALPLLLVACAGWSRVGAHGRLGPAGVIQAGCLGLAAAAQQLAWFPALGIVLCIALLRRGQLGDRRAAVLAARYAAVALAAFAVVDAPFIVLAPRAWLSGVMSVLTQHAVASGQGLVMLSVVVRGQAGRLDFYGYATVLTLLAALLWIALGFRRVAPAVPVLLALMFTVSTRSQGEYLVVLAPVWLVWLAALDRRAVAESGPWGSTAGSSHRWTTPRRRALIAVVAAVPALACVGVAVASDGPLQLRVTSTRMARGRITAISIDVVNRTSHAVRPSYYLDPPSHIRSPWVVRQGPAVVAAGQRAEVLLRPGFLGPETPTRQLKVWALSDSPASFSSVALPLRPR